MYIVVKIADNGPDIPLDMQPHIFEPFFTTKGVGVGTGLGLNISYRIVAEMHK
jgi:signal transduction histidine kinase